jgi:hypothetical protein
VKWEKIWETSEKLSKFLSFFPHYCMSFYHSQNKRTA